MRVVGAGVVGGAEACEPKRWLAYGGVPCPHKRSGCLRAERAGWPAWPPLHTDWHMPCQPSNRLCTAQHRLWDTNASHAAATCAARPCGRGATSAQHRRHRNGASMHTHGASHLQLRHAQHKSAQARCTEQQDQESPEDAGAGLPPQARPRVWIVKIHVPGSKMILQSHSIQSYMGPHGGERRAGAFQSICSILELRQGSIVFYVKH